MSILLHDYDAAKRREYYLKTRQLKGRAKSSASTAVARVTPAKHPVQTYAQRQVELKARVARLQAKLAQLQAAVKVFVDAAQKKAGIDTNTAEKAATAKYQKKTSDPMSKYEKKTPSEKAKAAKASQKYRDNNKVLEDQVIDLNKKIAAVRERIARIKKTGSVGARNSIK